MKYVLSIFLSVCVSASYADTLTDVKTVKRVFSEGASTAGFFSAEGIPQCLYGIMYIDLSKDSGKAQFSMLLSAKAANQKVVRMDYTLGVNGQCNMTGLHVE